MAARLAFPDAQQVLSGGLIDRLPGPNRTSPWSCGWYGTSISAERGCFALVGVGGPLDPLLIGDRVRVTYRQNSVVVYVFGSADLDFDLHLARRPFMALELLAAEAIGVSLEILSGGT